MHIGDDNSLPTLSSGAADALTYRNPHAGNLALKGSQHKFASLQEIKSNPVQIGQCAKKKRRHVGRVGKTIALTGKQCGQLSLKVAVDVGLGEAGIGIYDLNSAAYIAWVDLINVPKPFGTTADYTMCKAIASRSRLAPSGCSSFKR